MQRHTIDIHSLDLDGRGVGHLPNEDGTPGKVIFVEGALPGERVTCQPLKAKKNWETAQLVELHRESTLRVKPKCRYFGLCGGCAMQHLEPSAQVAIKQRVLEDNLWHIGRIRPEMMLSPIQGPSWGYRYRARLSVNFVPKKGGILIGFHEKKSRYITDMQSCEILPPNVSALLVPLRRLIESLSIVRQMPQIEVALGDGKDGLITALVLRIMVPLTPEDEVLLKVFADEHGIQWWLQPKGPDTAYQFYPTEQQLHYTLPEFDIAMPFKPTDFTQVNHQINRVLVGRALRLLEPQPHERIADLFCGLGNFTLPLATLAREVVGIEGSAALTQRAQDNALANRLEGKTSFATRNLFEVTAEDFVKLGKFDRMLFDPPRDGALAVCQAIAQLGDLRPQRIVYVSCSPSTLARDAGLLVNEAGYVLKMAGVINMFPHTSHVESMAVFDLAP
ncbi:MAG: 23S rRNA (uracil(1939)-C(5))-methyltransferase RlmD [Burkholderiaceae bacterium]|nr:23S rRNA (uracil(1939)-C(5))-methyltransferase RlmD [Burkholderiaceae bacterium]